MISWLNDIYVIFFSGKISQRHDILRYPGSKFSQLFRGDLLSWLGWTGRWENGGGGWGVAGGGKGSVVEIAQYFVTEKAQAGSSCPRLVIGQQ